MIEIGDRIIVAMSSAKGKEPCRSGSTGRVTHANFNTYNAPASVCNNKNKNISRFLAVHTLKVVFDRYGFEKKPRLETKGMVALMPYIHLTTEDVKVEEVASEAVDWLIDSFAAVCKAKNELNMSSSALLGIVIPYPTKPMNIIKSIEKKTWFEAVLRSQRFSNIINRILEDKDHKVVMKSGKYNWLSRETTRTIYDIISDSAYRKKVMTSENPSNDVINVLEAIKRIHVMDLKQKTARTLEEYLREYSAVSQSDGRSDALYAVNDAAVQIHRHIYSEFQMAIMQASIESFEGNKRGMELGFGVIARIRDNMLDKISEVEQTG